MSGDLRRKLVLQQLSKVDELLVGEEEEDDQEGADILGNLPSMINHFKSSEHAANKVNTDEVPNYLPKWDSFFTNNDIVTIKERNFAFNTYYTLPTSYEALSIPIFVFHHGAGSSGLTFANIAKDLIDRFNGKCGCFAFDARGHGQTRPLENSKEVDYNLHSFIDDFVSLFTKFCEDKLSSIPQQKLSLILMGHSLGGSICTFSHSHFSKEVTKLILGVTMLDIVEEAAIAALKNVQQFLSHVPNVFNSYDDAISWYNIHGLSKLKSSAEISIPSLFRKTKSGRVVRITNLNDFKPFWDTWFVGLSQKFVTLPTCKLLILAGNDNLDKELIVGQMQGKYQLVVFQDSGHFIQEDSPTKTSLTLIDFWKRNDNKNVVIKTNWGGAKTHN